LGGRAGAGAQDGDRVAGGRMMRREAGVIPFATRDPVSIRSHASRRGDHGSPGYRRAERAFVTSPAPRGLPLTFYSVAEPEPGPGWQGLFSSAWPAYRRWYLRDGAAARTGLRECQRMLATHMPELLPTWRRLVELAGGDPLAAQMLTLYNPPPYITGCSQAVHLGAERALVRNYDRPGRRLLLRVP
jgi:hypothetical protein